MRDRTRKLGLAGIMLLTVAVAVHFTGLGPETPELGTTPAGVRAPYEVVVTLRTEGPRPFEYRQALSRSEYNDVRFSSRRLRERVVKEARERYAKRLGRFSRMAGSARVERIQVKDVQLVDHRSRRRESILRASNRIDAADFEGRLD